MEKLVLCKNCFFYEAYLTNIKNEIVDDYYGECHRYPPKKMEADRIAISETEGGNYCGEFRRTFDDNS